MGDFYVPSSAFPSSFSLQGFSERIVCLHLSLSSTSSSLTPTQVKLHKTTNVCIFNAHNSLLTRWGIVTRPISIPVYSYLVTAQYKHFHFKNKISFCPVYCTEIAARVFGLIWKGSGASLAKQPEEAAPWGCSQKKQRHTEYPSTPVLTSASISQRVASP